MAMSHSITQKNTCLKEKTASASETLPEKAYDNIFTIRYG